MAFELTYSDVVSYPDKDGGILLYVALSRAELRATAEAVVDSGGSVCLFSRELGVALGLEVETGIPKRTPNAPKTIYRNTELFIHGSSIQ